MMNFVFDREDSIAGKEGNAGYQHMVSFCHILFYPVRDTPRNRTTFDFSLYMHWFLLCAEQLFSFFFLLFINNKGTKKKSFLVDSEERFTMA